MALSAQVTAVATAIVAALGITNPAAQAAALASWTIIVGQIYTGITAGAQVSVSVPATGLAWPGGMSPLPVTGSASGTGTVS